MGLLDDAIREHLDLKRRRGADPAEVERLEREALGPVRRGPAPVEAGTYEQAPGRPQDLEPEEWDEEDWEEDELEPAPGDAPAHATHDIAPVQFGAAGGERHAAAPFDAEDRDYGAYEDEEEEERDDPAAREIAAGATPAPHPAAAPPPEPELPRHADQETVEYQALQGEHEGDSMLEETPEFLQDTPDHDRLWFEQRPPRDFDFDG